MVGFSPEYKVAIPKKQKGSVKADDHPAQLHRMGIFALTYPHSSTKAQQVIEGLTSISLN